MYNQFLSASQIYSPIYRLPILGVDRGKQKNVIKRGMSKVFAGVGNDLFCKAKTTMLCNGVKDIVTKSRSWFLK